MTTARETQKVEEVFSAVAPAVRETQKVVEVFSAPPPPVLETQKVEEVWYQLPVHVRETQKVVEVWYQVIPPVVIPPARYQWQIHRCDNKPRTEQSA